MEKVFKALSDNTRRQLLDYLKETDGQTLGELESRFPDITRFAVMKHLKILEKAELIASRKSGRFKYHYLNTVPIQEIADRWISRFAVPWSQGLVDLKRDLEGEQNMNQKPKHVYNVIIQTTNEKLWDAITNPDITQHYFFGLRVISEWNVGSDIAYLNNAGEESIRGIIIECSPQSKVVYSFRGHKDMSEAQDPDSRVSFEIEQLGSNTCKLTVVHDEFETENTTYVNVGNGWPTILSGLKTYLETGKPLVIES